MKQIYRVTHSTDDVYPRSRKEIIKKSAFENRYNHPKDTQIKKYVVPDMMLGLIEIKLTEYCKYSEYIPDSIFSGEESRFYEVTASKKNTHYKIR